MTFEIIVQLKKEVLDPEGRAIYETLSRLGHASLRGVTVSKRYLVELDDADGRAAEEAERVAKEYLANPVSETFQVKRL
jgi:phosphoribosylformylglycinamidine synthase PurS subunit